MVSILEAELVRPLLTDVVGCEGLADCSKSSWGLGGISLKDTSPAFKTANQHLLQLDPELLIQFLILVISVLPWGNGSRRI